MSEIRAAETISRELERQRATTTVIVLQKFSRHTIEVVKAVARSYVYAQQIAESLARTFRIPMLVIGWEMPSTAEHITRSLLSSGYTKNNPGGSIFGSPQLPPVLSHVREGINDRAWYKKLPVYKNRPAGTSIDEYPYASTAQGGEANYNNNMVSLKAVPVKEQNRQGGIMPNFYRWGMVGDGGMSDMTSWYLNFAHFGSMSYMLDRSGNKRFFSYGV